MQETTNENITVWDSPDSKVETVNGKVTYRKWCEMEMERWAKCGKQTRLLECDGQICIGRV